MLCLWASAPGLLNHCIPQNTIVLSQKVCEKSLSQLVLVPSANETENQLPVVSVFVDLDSCFGTKMEKKKSVKCKR